LTGVTINDEFERRWEEEIVAYCEFPSWDLSAVDRGKP